MDRWIDGWTDRWVDGRADRWMDRKMNGWSGRSHCDHLCTWVLLILSLWPVDMQYGERFLSLFVPWFVTF
jgi:hypothetical protein